jgi:tRNA(Ile)-lysidine synthase TilS/MesJ
MLKDGDRILVAMSGGKDSMSLLHILLFFQKKGIFIDFYNFNNIKIFETLYDFII